MHQVIMTFWTFDVTHPGHKYYLNQAKKLWNKLITIVARDSNVLNIKWKNPLHQEMERVEMVKKLGISDIVELWDEKNPYLCIQKHKPTIICFGYDQKSFNEWVKAFCTSINLNCKIVTINPYFPDTYKSSKIKEKIPFT